MLDVSVRFKEKDVTVRYEVGKVKLEQILKQYDATPFGVTLAGPIVTVARTKQMTLRGWTQKATAKPNEAKASEQKNAPVPIQLFVEFIPVEESQIVDTPDLSMSDPPASGLEVLQSFKKVEADQKPRDEKIQSTRFVARLYETVALQPGEIAVPVSFKFSTTDASDAKHDAAGKLNVVLRTVRKTPSVADVAGSGVALIDGRLELRLGHLCDQKGCVTHFHKSLGEITGLAAVHARPDLKDPRATVHLRAGQPVDVWALREKLRDQSIEIASAVPNEIAGYRLRVELPRWRIDGKSDDVEQCTICRDRLVDVLKRLTWVKDAAVAGGGINFWPVEPSVDLIELLDAITNSGAAPAAVWLVPEDVPFPKASPALVRQPVTDPKTDGLQAHPVIEFDLSHQCNVGSDVSTLLTRQKWVSLAHVHSGEPTIASTAIADRKYANLTPILHGLRSVGHWPQQIRLRGFGDIRVQIQFAHICGEVEFSKPPKRKKPSAKKQPDKKQPDKKPDDKKKKDEKKQESKPAKPFVPKPLRPAASSNGRKAIEAAVNRVEWIKNGVYRGYHTKPVFTGGPTKLMMALQASGEDLVRLDELVQSLRDAGFPPKSVTVSRRFSSIPFGKPLPGDVQLTDREGKEQTLSSLKKPNRPLAIAFVSLKCKRHKKYKADPKFYEQLKQTIEKYKDRIDFIAVSANPDDKFPDVVEFWDKTGLTVPLLHDAQGMGRRVLHAQETPAPHLFIFDSDGLFRHAGDPHTNWEKPDQPKDDFLAQALDLVIAGKYQVNGAVFFNKSLCNCSDPKCKCPKCGCGPSCRCSIKH